MKTLVTEYHSCYDEMLSKLFMLSCGMEEIDNNETTSVSLVSKNIIYDNMFDLTAHEIIIYSLLLHKCIEVQNEEQEVSYSELQQLRGKRVSKATVLDELTYRAYDRAFKGLCRKRIKYILRAPKSSKRKGKRSRVTFKEAEHPLLILEGVKKLSNGDKLIKYSLGPFGKALIESGRYSTLVPSQYFKINFNEVMTYQIALYICRMIYINRKKKNITIKLTSIMKNTSKFMNSEKYGIVKQGCSLYDYKGENIKRYWGSTIIKANELLEILKYEHKIKDYSSVSNTNHDYQNVKWILQI